jgi:VanZ like family
MLEWGRQSGVVALSILAAPFVIWFARHLGYRRRRRGIDASWARRSAYAEVLMIAGTAPWLFLVLMPNHGNARGYNLTPFRDLANQVHTGLLFAVSQITGNLLVFAALGFGLMVRFRLRPLQVLLIGALGSTVIETLQWFLPLGRYSSVDDVLVNAVGAYLAAWLAYPWWRRHASVIGQGSRIEVDQALMH